VGLGGAAWSLLGLRRWSMSLLVVAQLVAIPVLLPLARGGMPLIWLVIGLAGVILALVLAPATTTAATK